MKIYVASSWRNQHQPDVVRALIAAGHDVYDFKAPAPGNDGFHWSEIDGGWKTWTLPQYAKALEHPLAAEGFASDMGALDAADLVVLVLPSGRSASWEYGYWCGKTGKQGIVHCPEKVEPELMYKGSWFTLETDGLVGSVARWDRERGGPLMKDLTLDGLVEELRALQPTPNLPFDVWKAIGQLVVQPAVELVVSDGISVLLTYRRDEHWDAWHIPGGFMSPGESFQEACDRVAARELGVMVKFAGVYDAAAWESHPYVNMVSIFCRVEIDHRGSLKDGQYFPLDALPGVMVPAHAEFLTRMSHIRRGR